MKFYILLSFVSFFALNTLETPTESKSVSKVVSWNKSQKLNWLDFKGTPKAGSPYAAECNWEINYSYSFNPHKAKGLEFEVNCYFNAAKSWVRNSDKSEGLLQHEQLHFDIAELCSRKLRQRLAEKEFNKENFKEEINVIFQEILKECDQLQNSYDEQTNHGLIKSKQNAWIKSVNKQINDLYAYENNIQTMDSPFTKQNLVSKLFKKLNIL
jgi:hypothetical protein